MVRRQNVSPFRCSASGVVKGRRVTVTRLGEIDLANWGREGFVLADWPDAVIAQPVQTDGWLIPSTFSVDGLGFVCQFDLDRIGGERPRYGITRIVCDAFTPEQRAELDAANPTARRRRVHAVAPGEASVDRISLSALTRLALRAVAVRVLYVPQGTVLGIGGVPTGERLRDGDPAPSGKGVTGVSHVRDARGTLRIAYAKRPDPILLSLGGKVTSRDVRALMGQKSPGRRTGALSDPASLTRVAKLYREAQRTPLARGRVPAWVAGELATRHGDYKSESWVRQVAVKARKAGLLKSGKRKRKGGTR